MNATPRAFLADTDFTREEYEEILESAARIKRRPEEYASALRGEILAMIFQKPSTRTRVSFEVAMLQMGGHALYLGARDLQLGRGETIADTARVLSRYVSAIMARVFDHADVETLAACASVPVINGLSDALHPCQALADLFTIKEKRGRLAGLVLAYVGDGNNVCHSLMLAGTLMGLRVRVATPPGYEPQETWVRKASESARRYGGELKLFTDPHEAVRGAAVVYTDVWASMGQEKEAETRKTVFRPYQVNRALMDAAGAEALFMHCLPAHRNDEVTDDVIDGPRSIVWDQAENRLHAQKALLYRLLTSRGSP